MSSIFGILEFSDFAVITLIVIIFAGSATAVASYRSNLRRIERKLDTLIEKQGIELLPKLSIEVQRLAGEPLKKSAAIKLHQAQTGKTSVEAAVDIKEYLGE